MIAEGTLGGEAFVIDFANGGLAIEWGQAEVSDEHRALVDDAVASIIEADEHDHDDDDHDHDDEGDDMAEPEATEEASD